MLNSEKAVFAINNMDDSFLESAREMLGYKLEDTAKKLVNRRIITLALAAALILSLGTAAYAANLFGLRDLYANPNRGEMPDEAAAHIVAQNGSVEGDGWNARVMESYCDESTVLVTVQVSADTKYLVVPTDEDPNSSVSVIGLSGEGTLGDFARQKGKTLLFVGASLNWETLGLISGGQHFENTSPHEMTIYFEGARNGGSAAPIETTCTVVALIWSPETDVQNADSSVVEKHTLPVTLTESGNSSLGVYTPSDPYAVPGVELGELSLTQTPLGISMSLKMTLLDRETAEQLLTLRLEGVEFHGDGSMNLNGISVFSQGQGRVSYSPTLQFIDWDKNIVAEVTFEKIG